MIFGAVIHNEHAEADEVLTDIDVKAARFVSVEARPEQAAFRRKVFIACKGQCVISGCDVLKALDAAHKHDRDWRLGHNDAEDGYLLRKDLHALYDNNLLEITDKGEVQLEFCRDGALQTVFRCALYCRNANVLSRIILHIDLCMVGNLLPTRF